MVAKKGGQKRSICAQTRIPGVSVAQVARRYAMSSEKREFLNKCRASMSHEN
jgi:hypothetical protein